MNSRLVLNGFVELPFNDPAVGADGDRGEVDAADGVVGAFNT